MRIRQVDTSIWYDDDFQERTPMAKMVFVHLLLRKELNTLGVIATSAESIAGLLTGTSDERVKLSEVKAALVELHQHEMIMLVERPETAVWFPNFLRYQKWGRTVASGWPRILREIPNQEMRERVQAACTDYEREQGWK